jgi:hypothetical protein
VQSALLKIHFTADLWTSPNKHPLLGIIAYYIAENGDPYQSMLGLQEIGRTYTGENQDLIIIRLIAEFGIASKLGYFIIDNTNNNDTVIAALLVMLLDEYNIEYNDIRYRNCFNSCIINLVLSFLL